MEYRELQIAPVVVFPSTTNFKLTPATTFHPRVTDVTSSMPILDVDFWSPVSDCNRHFDANCQIIDETPTHEFLQATP